MVFSIVCFLRTINVWTKFKQDQIGLKRVAMLVLLMLHIVALCCCVPMKRS